MLTAAERRARQDVLDQAEYDAVIDDSRRVHPGYVVPRRNVPTPIRTKDRHLKPWTTGYKRKEPISESFVSLVFSLEQDWRQPERGIIGWSELAYFVGCDERTIRRAYVRDPLVRKCIHKRGGRYWADPSEVMWHLMPYLASRFGKARARSAASQRRSRLGRFKA